MLIISISILLPGSLSLLFNLYVYFSFLTILQPGPMTMGSILYSTFESFLLNQWPSRLGRWNTLSASLQKGMIECRVTQSAGAAENTDAYLQRGKIPHTSIPVGLGYEIHRLPLCRRIRLPQRVISDPVGLGYRIHRMYLCRGVRHSKRVFWYDSKQSDGDA